MLLQTDKQILQNFNKSLKDMLSLNDSVLIASYKESLYLYAELEVHSFRILQVFKQFNFLANEHFSFNLIATFKNNAISIQQVKHNLNLNVTPNNLKTLYSLTTCYEQAYKSYHAFKLSDRYKKEASEQSSESLMTTIEGYDYDGEAYLKALKLFDGEVDGEIKEDGSLEFVKDNTVAILPKIN